MSILRFCDYVLEDGLIGDLSSLGFDSYSGWMVMIYSEYTKGIEMKAGIYAVVAKSVFDASEMIIENLGILDHSDSLIEPLSGDTFEECLEEPAKRHMSRFKIARVYSGLVPIKGEDYCLEIDWTNPKLAIKDLKSIFSNVDAVLDRGF